MNNYIARHGDTLRSIAFKLSVELEQLLSLNPRIVNPDSNIAGQTVSIIPVCGPQEPMTNQKHWIPLTPIEQMSQTEYDVLIVGTGAGGPAALWRLCDQWGRNGKRIGIIDRGDLLIPTHAMNLPTMNGVSNQEYFRNISYPLGKILPQFSGAREVFAVGGRTLFWSATTPRMDPADMYEWPISYEELISYYNIAERSMNVTKGYTQDSMLSTAMLEILRKSGYPEATEMPMAVDLSATKFGQIHSNAVFSSIAFLAMALNRRSYDLAARVRAVQVFAENGKATGIGVITPDKKYYFIKAKTIVLSAGTWETPRLLLYSGFHGRAIGHYLMNHSKIVATVKVDRSVFPEILGTLNIWIPRTTDRHYQFTIFGPDMERYKWYSAYENKPVLKELEIGIEALGVVEPRFENHLSLNPNRLDADGIPEIQVNFSYSEQDKVVIGKIMQSLNDIISGILSSTGTKSREPDFCLRVPGDDYHEMGTCRMGDNPSTSATNRYGQLHGMSNLYVADNSILPYSGAANPTLTTVALAIRTADHIINKMCR